MRSVPVAIAMLCMWVGPLHAQNFSNTIFFGDSNMDSGRYLYIPGPDGKAPAGTGTYTTNPDPPGR